MRLVPRPCRRMLAPPAVHPNPTPQVLRVFAYSSPLTSNVARYTLQERLYLAGGGRPNGTQSTLCREKALFPRHGVLPPAGPALVHTPARPCIFGVPVAPP